MRWPNVVIVILVQATFYYSHLLPLLAENGLERQFSDLHVALFILCSALITGSGNVINDIFDVATDEINKPEKMIIGRLISEKEAINLYVILTLAGTVLAIYLAWYVGRLDWLWIYFVSIFLLWYYSKRLKGIVLLGNLTISVFCIGIFVVILLLEYNGLRTVAVDAPEAYANFQQIIYGFSALAFLITFSREIVKDAEDVVGDLETGWMTFPSMFGLKKTSILIRSMLFLFLVMIGFWLYIRPITWIDLTICLLGFVVPLLMMFFVLRIHDQQDIYKKISLHLKLMMLIAVIYLQVL